MTQLTKATEKGGLSGLVEEAGTVASEVAVTVADQLPSLVQGGVSIVQSLVSGIDQNRGSIAQSVMLGLSTMLTGIMKLAPQLLSLGAGMLLLCCRDWISRCLASSRLDLQLLTICALAL